MLHEMSEAENLERLFYLTGPVIFTPSDYADKDAVFQFELKGTDAMYSYYLEIEGGKMDYSRGRHLSPDIVIETSVSEWLKIANRTASPALSVMSGRTKVHGRMGLFRSLGKALDINSMRYRDEVEAWERPKDRLWKKPDRVTVINGSPRGKNGYTHYYLSRLLDGIKSSGVAVEQIDVYDKALDISPCKGCFSCWEAKREGRCVLNDDSTAINEKIFDSYLTIYAFPVYIDSVPARLKALMDRQFIALKNQFSRVGDTTRHPLYRKPNERYTAVFATNGFPERDHFETPLETFRRNARSFKAPLIAEVIRPGATALYEEPTLYPHLQKVQRALEEAGCELIERGRVKESALERIASLPAKYTKDAWYFMANRFNALEDKRPPRSA